MIRAVAAAAVSVGLGVGGLGGLGLAACGPRAATVTPTGGRAIDAGDAGLPGDVPGDGPDAAPPDPAMAEVLAALRDQRDRMCGCAARACAEDAEVAAFEWGFAHKALVDGARPTPAQADAARVLIEATERCAERWRDDPHDHDHDDPDDHDDHRRAP